MKVKSLSRVRLFVTPWTVAYQAPQSMEFSRQEYWSGLPFPSPGDLPNPGIEPVSPTMQADALPSEPPGKLNWNFGFWSQKLKDSIQNSATFGSCRNIKLWGKPDFYGTCHYCHFKENLLRVVPLFCYLFW